MPQRKKLLLLTTSTPAQVGDGFFIRRALPERRFPSVSPFLMLDHAGPTSIAPTDIPKGVDAHPHRGFETVSIVYQGALEHRDSAGNYGKLFAGDVQWMTAASGIVHEEKHEKEFSRQGGTLEMIQLWVNLPAKDKMSAPKYQDIRAADIPVVTLPTGGGEVRVIAGEYAEMTGAARTFTPLSVLDVRMQAKGEFNLQLPADTATVIYVLDGEFTFNETENATGGMTAFFHTDGTDIHLRAAVTGKLLILNGQPIDEPVVSYGPFVMNTQQQIAEALQDYRAGKMGRL